MKALITGASSGIGRSIALKLADLGYDLYVVSRNQEDLNQIYGDCRRRVFYLEYDLRDEESCYDLYERLKDEDIDLLVNNAGIGDCGNFVSTRLEKEISMIELNIRAYHILMKLFLKEFVKKNHGRILNVASMAGVMPVPYMATYYATKAYIVSLSLAVSEELKQAGSRIKISVFCPGPVKTDFSRKAHVHFRIDSLSADEAAECALEGMFSNQLMIIPNNMKMNYILTKVSPICMILKMNSNVQERTSK